jgi:peptide/nickel transport system substrate-binding protein
MRFSYLQMNTTAENSPFKDIRVRQAVNHAINKQAIAENIVGQGSVVLDAPCYVTQFGCTQEVKKYEYDPAKAKALLAEAGYPNGLDVDLWAYRERQYVEAMIGQLSAVGIRPKLNFVQYPVFRQATREGKTHIANGTWGSNGVNDVSSSTSYFFRLGADDQNKDEQVAKWLEVGDNTADPATRKENYRKALERIAEQAYWAPLFSYSKIYIFHKDLEFEGFYDEWARFYWSKWKQ